LGNIQVRTAVRDGVQARNYQYPLEKKVPRFDPNAFKFGVWIGIIIIK